MKRIVFSLIIASLLALTGCSSELSLQRYFVDHQEEPNFISQDVPVSMVEIDKTNFTDAQLEAYKSIRRLNFLGFKVDDSNLERYEAEVAKVKAILQQGKYEDLMEFSDKGRRILIKFIGDEEEADEVIVFGNAKDMGFAVVRILGSGMSPEKIITLADALKQTSVDESQLEDMLNFFK